MLTPLNPTTISSVFATRADRADQSKHRSVYVAGMAVKSMFAAAVASV